MSYYDKERRKDYYYYNRENILAYQRQYYYEHREEIKYRRKELEAERDYYNAYYFGYANLPTCKEVRHLHYIQFRDWILAYLKRWRQNNPDYMKIWLKNNPDYMKNYYQNNKERLRLKREGIKG